MTEVLTFLVPVSHNTMLFSSPKMKANTKYYVVTSIGGNTGPGR